MDKELYDYLTKIGYADYDIEFLCQICRGLNDVSAERAMANIAAVVRAGYPEDDIDGLIAMNPDFLLNDPVETAQKLAYLDNVEEALKDNPELI